MDALSNSVLAPALELHHKACDQADRIIMHGLDRISPPASVSARYVALARAALLVPSLHLVAEGHHILPMLFVLLSHGASMVGNSLARWQVKKHGPPIASQKDSFRARRMRNQLPALLDLTADNIFLMPQWVLGITMTHSFVLRLGLWCLLVTETLGAFLRLRTFFLGANAPLPSTATSSESSHQTRFLERMISAKVMLLYLGTALLHLFFLRYLGFVLLIASIPLAGDVVRRKLQRNRVLVVYTGAPHVTAKELIFLERCRSLGHQLLVGIPAGANNAEDVARTMRLLMCVDEVLTGLPARVDRQYLDQNNVDCVAYGLTDLNRVVTDDVAAACHCVRVPLDADAGKAALGVTGGATEDAFRTEVTRSSVALDASPAPAPRKAAPREEVPGAASALREEAE